MKTMQNKGFSLIEIIASTVILALLAGGIFATTSYIKRMSLRAREKMVAVELVEKKMNEIKESGVKNISDGTLPVDNVTGLLKDGKVTSTVSTKDGDERLKQVVVKVEWKDKLGQPKSETGIAIFYQE